MDCPFLINAPPVRGVFYYLAGCYRLTLAEGYIRFYRRVI